MAKWLFLLPSDLMGGAEYNVLKLADELSLDPKNQIDVVFLSRREIENSRWDDLKGVNLIRIPASRELIGVFLFIGFLLIGKPRSYDYIFSTHVHTNSFVSLLRKFRLLSSSRLFLRESTNIFSWFSGLKLCLMKFFYSFYSSDALLICQTNAMYKELVSNIPRLRDNKYVVLRNPLDCEAIRFQSTLADDFKKSVDVVRVVAVGRLVSEKAFDQLIKAVALMDNGVELYLIGGGPELEHLQVLAKTLGVEERVFFMGQQVNPFQYMRGSDVSVVSSRLEGFPNVLLEMMCLSHRIVATRCAEGVENLPGILTCEVEDSEALAETINEALSLREDELIRMSNEREKYLSSISSERYINELLLS
jgi:glycosyltransferase involved in cell wall biosynthesis